MSEDPLADYRRRRDFGRTPEPAAVGGVGDGDGFVVQRHESRSPHWDLRLQMGDVLGSWAVPKGFSYDPSQKRLAVRTEDHPLSYLTFEGVIPPGEYGAGTMTVWDRGRLRWLPGYGPRADADELKFVLDGRRLRGEWHLVRMRGDGGPNPPWLLFKAKDRYAGPDRDSAAGHDLAAAVAQRMPSRLRPMAAADGVVQPFDDPEWLFELVFAGERALVYVDHERDDQPVRRSGSGALPEPVLRALDQMRLTRGVLDGVVGDDALYLWDILHFDGFDLRPLPLRQRKGILRHVLPPGLAALQFVDHVAGTGRDLAAALAAAGGGELRARRGDGPYVSGPGDHCLWIRVAAAPAAQQGRAAARSKAKPKFSHLDKVLWPEEGYTKGDLIRYYQEMGDVLLPYLQDRPLHLHRFPDGIHQPSFYQRHGHGSLPDGVGRVAAAAVDGTEDLLTVVSAGGPAALANLGSIDLHPWLASLPGAQLPDQAVWDLDPKGAPFGAVVALARLLGDLLRSIGLRPQVKTSGQQGLHLYVGIAPQLRPDQVAMFCEGVARVAVLRRGDLATLERSIPRRGGRIYIDVQQNRRGQSVVAPYAVRPVRGATVSTPLQWEELADPALRPARFTILSVPRRVAELGDVFRPVLDDPQDLMAAIDAFAALLEP